MCRNNKEDKKSWNDQMSLCLYRYLFDIKKVQKDINKNVTQK